MAEKILIIDDDVDTLRLLYVILKREGFEIVAANGGALGVSKAAAERPDLILLDLMMPDLDGYEVLRRLRADPALVHTPIIVFSAKDLLDDKVAGFELGADDYLTKPTHPTELVAHVRALLSRLQTPPAAVPAMRARVVGFAAAKGGIGLTTLALNVAVTVVAEEDTVLAELRPGQGGLGLMLGIGQSRNLGELLARQVGDFNSRAVGAQLLTHSSGLRFLPASIVPSEAKLINNVQQMEMLVKTLSTMCQFLALDLGVPGAEALRRAAALCDTVVVAVDTSRLTVARAKAALDDFTAMGLSASRLELVVINRFTAGFQLGRGEIESALGMKVAAVFTPAVELAFQAVEVCQPMVLTRPESTTADQARDLAAQLRRRMRVSTVSV